jgi:N-acetylmuramoyl-L-alanine amidase
MVAPAEAVAQVGLGGRPPTVVRAAAAADRACPTIKHPFVIAIDAGHGGSNLGAAGIAVGGSAPDAARTVFEKQVTLALARRLRSQLAARTDFRVVLCRDDDLMVPIRARARCAEQAHADLFISLHANASPPGITRGTRRGFEVYVLSPQEREDEASLAAARATDPADAVWAAHEAMAQAERSILAARLITDRLAERLGRDMNRGVRQSGASLDVLRGAAAPAALVEVGFIDHPAEGQLLASPAGQDLITTALAAAVSDFAQR